MLEFMGITLLFLDEKVRIQFTLRLQNSVIHRFIPAGRSPYYRPLLKAGSVMRVSRYEIVGQIQSVQDSDLAAAGVMTRVVVPFLIEPMVVVYLSLWDDVASMFRGLISSGDRTQSVMVVTTVNPKIFGGNLYLNATPATKFDFDPALQAIAEFTASLKGPSGEAFPCIDTKHGIKKKEVVSIGERNKFITNSDEQTHEADLICKARAVEVLQQNGWFFISCTGCSKKLDKFGSSLRCNRCANPNVTGVIKYRVELFVDDGDDNAIFVVFDREMVKLTKQDAPGLTLDETFKITADEFVQVEGGEASASASKNVKGEAYETSPSLMEAQKAPVNTPVSEVKKLDHRQPTYAFVSSMHFSYLDFPFSLF
uniref:Replication factor A C-terminal domain-containing protein n=1 Tax=Brassica campestris TaxID=3711 RepID=M4F5B2_BRACM